MQSQHDDEYFPDVYERKQFSLRKKIFFCLRSNRYSDGRAGLVSCLTVTTGAGLITGRLVEKSCAIF